MNRAANALLGLLLLAGLVFSCVRANRKWQHMEKRKGPDVLAIFAAITALKMFKIARWLRTRGKFLLQWAERRI